MSSENPEGKTLELIPEVTGRPSATRGMFANRANPRYIEENFVLFDEKERNHTGFPLRAESNYSFYDRSSLSTLAHRRQMLQRWVDRMPPNKQKDIVGRMKHNGPGSLEKDRSFDSAFFELFLHEFLNGTGGDTVVEPRIGGLTPDFGVTGTSRDGTPVNYVVEAVDVNIRRGTELESKWNELHALDMLDEIEAPDFQLQVETTGTLDNTPRKKSLKQPFEELVGTSNYDDVRAELELHGTLPETSFHHGNWAIRGRLIPMAPELHPRRGRFVSYGPFKLAETGSVAKMRSRLHKKHGEYPDVENLIIAVRTDWWDFKIEDALFGSRKLQVKMTRGPNGKTVDGEPSVTQDADGFWFNPRRDLDSNLIGVAVFYDIHPNNIDRARAVFYANPYTEKPLPSWATEIAHAEYHDGEIEIVDGLPAGAFAKDHEVRDRD